jgi:pSer/pThr/pTyr-binding forkhead associated (FHA) protein
VLYNHGIRSAKEQSVRFALVTIRTPNGEEYDFRLGRRSFTVGRRADCDLALPSPEVSSVHARFDTDPVHGTLTVTDLDSKNGTFVEDALAVPDVATRVAPGSPVGIANITLTVRFIDSATDDSASLSFDTSSSLSRSLLRGLVGEAMRQGRAQLEVVAGPARGARLALEEHTHTVTLGTGAVELELREPALAASPLRVAQRGQSYEVLAPPGVPVWVRDQPVAEAHLLRHGDEIRVGQTRVLFSDPLQSAIDELHRLDHAEDAATHPADFSGDGRASEPDPRLVKTVRQEAILLGRPYSWGERLTFAVAILSLLAALGFLLVVLGVLDF